MQYYWVKIGITLACCLFISSLVNADLVFSAPPRETPENGAKIYGPLAEHLTSLLGEKVTYEYPKNWLQYQRDVRNGHYDIVFDGPHFVSWRMARLEHEVLVKLPGTLEFVIVINDDDTGIKTTKDLIGKKICAIPPPNLATLTVIDLFSNPVRQPVIWGVRGGFRRVFTQFSQHKCRAAVFRSAFFYKKLSEQDRINTRVLFKSKPLPNQAISVGNKIDKKSRLKIIRSITLGKGKDVSKAITKRFGGKKGKPFIVANQTEYKKHIELLEGIVFGW